MQAGELFMLTGLLLFLAEIRFGVVVFVWDSNWTLFLPELQIRQILGVIVLFVVEGKDQTQTFCVTFPRNVCSSTTIAGMSWLRVCGEPSHTRSRLLMPHKNIKVSH